MSTRQFSSDDAHTTPTTNPWALTQSRTVYDNPWITVRHDDVTQPDGTPGIYGVVGLKNIATGVIALRDDGMIPLVGQWRYPLNAYSWEIPQGGAPADESPLEAAQRELREETGITATRWTPILSTHLSNCVTDERGELFLAQDLELGSPAPDSDEQLKTCWVSFDEALLMAMDGRITDAMSQVGLLTVAHRGLAAGSGIKQDA